MRATHIGRTTLTPPFEAVTTWCGRDSRYTTHTVLRLHCVVVACSCVQVYLRSEQAAVHPVVVIIKVSCLNILLLLPTHSAHNMSSSSST